MTPQQFADQMGVKLQHAQRWFYGKNRPTTENLKKMCEVLNVPQLYLEMPSLDFEEMARHERVMKFYANEALGLNKDADYGEVQRIKSDLQNEAARESQDGGVRSGEITVPSSQESPSDPEPDPEGGTGD